MPLYSLVTLILLSLRISINPSGLTSRTSVMVISLALYDRQACHTGFFDAHKQLSFTGFTMIFLLHTGLNLRNRKDEEVILQVCIGVQTSYC